MNLPYKIPQSVLVVIYTQLLEVLLLRRADQQPDAEPFWQSVTGSKDALDEPWVLTAAREVWEETGIDCRPGSALAPALEDWGVENVYPIYPRWLHRYPPGITHNTERVWGLCLPHRMHVRLSPREHTDLRWLPLVEAADWCYSPSNAEAILQLSQRGCARDEGSIR